MDVSAPFVADAEPPEAMEPGDRAFDDPAEGAQAAAVGTARWGHDGDDALAREPRVAGARPIGAIALDHSGLPSRTPAAAADRRQSGDERLELRDVVDVRGGQVRDEGDAARVGNEVVLRAFLAAIGWVRSSFFPPRSARTDPLSITVQRWSSRPRRFNSASSVSCSRRHTPARSHCTSRRQHVLPDPHPISFGSICHGTPDRRTYRIPVRAARSGMGSRPCRWPLRFRRVGISGATRAHRPSSSSGRAMPDRTKRPLPVQGCQRVLKRALSTSPT